MKLLIPVLLNCVFVTGIYLLDKKTKFNKIPYMAKQVIIGLIFGAISAFSSDFGVEILSTVANMRDAAPLCAGLIFGGPAGIISGFIGGIYRWFAVYWGAGTFTRLACTVSTIFVGFAAAGLRKYMFDNKKPTWSYGIFITVVCEVVHMLMIFLTNMDNTAYAFEFIQGATIPMIIGNVLAVTISIISVTLLSREKLTTSRGEKRISQTFQRWLLVLIGFAFVVTSTFTYFIQDGIAGIETREVFTTGLSDVITDIRGKSDKNLLAVAGNVKEDYLKNEAISLEALAKKHEIAEINIVSEDGLVMRSTEKNLVGTFNMNSTEQSKAFMVLTEGESEFVQQYSPVGSDGVTMRKFAGLSLPDGGFIQVGYDSEQFHSNLDDFVVDVTQNRHMGSEGFIAVCNESFNLVTHTERNGDHISTIGIEPGEEMLSGASATQLYKTNIINNDTRFNEEYIYAFTFVEGYCVIAAMPVAEAMLMKDVSLYTSVFMLVLIFACLFVFIYFLIKKVIINNLRKINGTLSQITDGNLNVTVDVRSNAEFSSLSDDINSTVSTLKRYINEAAARIDKELEYAKQIQHSALPSDFPDEKDYGIYARMIAAKEVGGDFYDFYKLKDDTVAFLIADVSGKGIPAAMFMMTAKTIIKDLAERGLGVDEIFSLANDKLCENNDSGMFVTAWMGILDISTGKLSYCNAGHNPPLIINKTGEFTYLRSRPGLVLAGMEGVPYRAQELQLYKGDRIFLYTDGVTEATDTANNLYGEQRVQSFLNSNKDADSEYLLHALKGDIDAFVGEAPQFDDITMLLFDYKKEEEGHIVAEKIFPAQKDALADVMAFLEEGLDSFACPMKTAIAISVAVEEIFVNVAGYAYGTQQGDVSLSMSFDPAERELTLVMRDKGKPFNPLEKPDPDITLSAEEREIGGLGIFITKKTMDTVTYAYEGSENILTMVKKI